MALLPDALFTFGFGANAALQQLFGSYWLIFLLPSLAAMVLTVLGHFGPRDLVLLFSIPGIAAGAWGTFAVLWHDASLHHRFLAYGSPDINTAMVLIAAFLLFYALIWMMSGSTALRVPRRIAAFLIVWALCATNLPLIYKGYTGPALFALEYSSHGPALGWIAGHQAGLFAVCLFPPALAGALVGRVPTAFRQPMAWLAICLYGAALTFTVLNISTNL